MDLEHLLLAILIVLIGVVAGLGVWYLAIRLNQPRVKMIAVVIGAFPLLGFGMQVATYFFDWGGPPDTYTTVTPGPASRKKSTTRDFPFPVTDHVPMKKSNSRREPVLAKHLQARSSYSWSCDLKKASGSRIRPRPWRRDKDNSGRLCEHDSNPLKKANIPCIWRFPPA